MGLGLIRVKTKGLWFGALGLGFRTHIAGNGWGIFEDGGLEACKGWKDCGVYLEHTVRSEIMV